MLNSEKRSLFRFLAIYLASTLILFSLASWIFYLSSKHHILDKQRESIKYESERIKSGLRVLHQSNDDELIYPKSEIVHSGIYDLDKNYIFGTFTAIPSLQEHHDKDKLYLITHIEPYYLGAAYLLAVKEIDAVPIKQLQKMIFLFMLGAGVFFTILGYFLGKLFIKPMRESMKRMNHFIQDATHELNTPISTILTNIEMIEALGANENKRELKRIEIASQMLSRIYDDLTYLNLNHQYHRHIVPLDMTALVKERIVYFSAMTEAKALTVMLESQSDVILEIDKNDALRLVDNLISNAIKYNRQYGKLDIMISKNQFSVKDTGVGIETKDVDTILQRFKRANKSEGGFGIGLDIVHQVVQHYGFSLTIDTQIKEGTEVSIRW